MARTFDPEGFGRRLRAGIVAAGLDIQGFQLAVRAATDGAKGTSYGSIWSYVNGHGAVEPRREVLEAMADVLGRTPEYLLTGTGPRTPAEAAAQAAAAAGEDPEEAGRILRRFRAMHEAEQRLPGLGSTYFYGRDQMLEGLVMDLLDTGEGFEGFTEGEVAEALYLVAWLIMWPADALHAVDFLNEGRGAEYFSAMATAIRIALAAPGQGFPRATLADLRAAKAAWEARLPRSMDEAEYREVTRDRGRGRQKLRSDDAEA